MVETACNRRSAQPALPMIASPQRGWLTQIMIGLTQKSSVSRRGLYKWWRSIVAHRRSHPADLALAITLAFIAGAINAGGFLAIGQYTSHMTGIVSSMADNLVLGMADLLPLGFLMLLFFVLGAATSAILINWARRNTRSHQYVFPIFLEALLLIAFGVIGHFGLNTGQKTMFLTPFLCFIMGLQNATITKISYARIRTTHLTGMMTDIGIETGKIIYVACNRLCRRPDYISVDYGKLTILLQIVGAFFAGGLIGAAGFGSLGYVSCLPFACILILLSAPHILRASRAEKATVAR